MSQGFNHRRHIVDRNEAMRWSLFRDVDEDPLPTHPEILPLVIQALRGRIRRMDRTKERRLAQIRIPPKEDINGMRRVVKVLLSRIGKLDRTKKKELACRVRLYIQVITQRERWPGELEENWLYRSSLGHYDGLFKDELAEIENGKLVNFTCFPAVLRLQRDLLYEYMTRHGSDGYAANDTPETWLKRNHKRLYEELAFYRCACTYRPDLQQISQVSEAHPNALALGKPKRKKGTSPSLTYSADSPQEPTAEWIFEEWPFPEPPPTIYKERAELDHAVLAALDSKGPGELIPAILAALHTGSVASSIRQTLKRARPPKIPSFLS